MNAPQRDELGMEFDRCSQWLQGALNHAGGTHTLADIEVGIREGRFQFWPADRSAAVTEVIQYPQRRVLHLFLAGGDLNQLRDMEASATEFARHMGCEAMSIAGRRGWVKALEGYEEYLTTVIKPVEPLGHEGYNGEGKEG